MGNDRRTAALAGIDGAQAASATECTGLVPALPGDEEGLERLAELCDVVQPEKRGRHRR